MYDQFTPIGGVLDYGERFTEPGHNVMGRTVFARHRDEPVFSEHPDTGCEFSPTCLECPLPACKYDDWAGARRYLHALRWEQIKRCRSRGLDRTQTARQIGMSPRTVDRAVAMARV